jgi:general secretion pathway protein G
MMKSKKLVVQSQRGFSLIEIMIVMTLLGLIGTFAVRNYMASREEGYRRGTKVLMQQLKTALDDFYRTCNAYPTTTQGLDALIVKPDTCKDWDPNGYLSSKKVPTDAWGRAFNYVCDDGRHFILKSLGASGKEGGEGNDKPISTDDPDF